MTTEDIVQKQLDAYNNRDITAFLSCFSNDIMLYAFSEFEPYLHGKEALEKMYIEIFHSSPKLYSKILNRMVVGHTVIDHEEITGRKGVELLELIAIYEVKNDLIVTGHFIRK